jgi:hypothetical protein
MTAQRPDVPAAKGAVPDVEEALSHQVVRRATQLCLRAEPHTDESPCAAHLAEAHRQLLGVPA